MFAPRPLQHLTPGPDLASCRRTTGLTAAAVGARVGVSRNRIANLEQAVSVRPEMAERVLRAIAELAAEAERES